MSSQTNPYVPFPSKVLKVVRHTKKEYTFRMAFAGDVRPGQFFEVSVPKFGEAPISVSGIVSGESVDLTIRRVGRVTNEMFDTYAGQSLLLRGPYGNGFDVDMTLVKKTQNEVTGDMLSQFDLTGKRITKAAKGGKGKKK